jgi:Tol biopolymer transport system component
MFLLIGPLTTIDAQQVLGENQPDSVPKVTMLKGNGGQVAWYKGTSHELIAIDAITDATTRNTEIFVLNPDGSGETCVTCDSLVPKGFIGNPAWHPDGEHLVFQAENANSNHKLYNHSAWGINQDLWVIRRDGKDAERIYSPGRDGGVLHPHVSDDGKLLIFAERVATGKRYPRLKELTPGGENPWDGWQIHIADFDLTKSGTAKLSNHRTIRPNGKGLYETHGFTPGGHLIYSHTEDGANFVDDIYSAKLDGSDVKALVDSRSTWDEHGAYSPDGRRFAFMSSRIRPSLRFPGPRPAELVTEMYLSDDGNPPRQITSMTERLGYDCVVSDLDWDRTGTRIVFQVASFKKRVPQQVWIVVLPALKTDPGRKSEIPGPKVVEGGGH